MRKLGLPWIVMCVAVLGLVLGGCAGKDGKNGAAGLAGTNGTNGTNGTDGINGIDGTGIADCQPCHSDTATFAVRPAFAQWRHSVHASEAILWETNQGAPNWCASCHNNEGFVSTVRGAPAVAAMPTSIGCSTCHAPHTNKNFTLRTTAAYTLKNGVVFDKGRGNLCANCHHSRADVRATFPADSTMLPITSQFFGPHEGPQAEAYEATGGYEFGQVIPRSAHYNQITNSCVACHMFSPIGTMVGGHSFAMKAEEGGANQASCMVTGCHPGETFPEGTFDRLATQDWDGDGTTEGTQTEFDGLLGNLRAALVARGALNPGPGDLTDTAVPGRYPKNVVAAVYNFRLALREGSRGIHNTKYIMNLMKLSLQNLPALS